MKLNDVQDITKREIKKEQRNAAYNRMHDEYLEKVSAFYSNKKVAIFGVTFTV